MSKVSNQELSRGIHLIDVNPAGNLHVEVVLDLLEQVGYLRASQHCNSFKTGKVISDPILGRIDRAYFMTPGHIGNRISAKGEIVYTSSRSMRVIVEVYYGDANLEKTLINKSVLWFVNGLIDEETRKFVPRKVPELDFIHKDYETSHMEYLRNKETRMNNTLNIGKLSLGDHITDVRDKDVLTPRRSTVVTYYIPTGTDCLGNKVLRGKNLLEKMGENGAISAAKHCHHFVEMVCVEAVEFHNIAFANELIVLHSIVTFTSQHCIDVWITAYYEDLHKVEHRLICTANFTYKAFGQDNKPVDVPKLELTNDQEKELFRQGNERYLSRKKIKKDQ